MRALLLALLILIPLLAHAETLPETKQVEDYLRGITTMQARFLQTSGDGSQVAGDFLLKRPGRMKFTYDKPIEDFIVADGLLVYYYDSQLKEQSSAPISQSLADFFLRPDLRLSGDIQVSGIKRENGYLQIALVQSSDPTSGSLTLLLEEKPRPAGPSLMTLKKWRVVDAQGLITEVELFNTVRGIALDNDLFHYYDPKRKKEKFN